MANVLLVGEKPLMLQILATMLEGEEHSAHLAADVRALEELLPDADLVIFEHVTPTDLFELNPRLLGYAGPLLLLADVPGHIAEELTKADILLLEPFFLHDVRRSVKELLAAAAEA